MACLSRQIKYTTTVKLLKVIQWIKSYWELLQSGEVIYWIKKKLLEITIGGRTL